MGAGDVGPEWCPLIALDDGFLLYTLDLNFLQCSFVDNLPENLLPETNFR